MHSAHIFDTVKYTCQWYDLEEPDACGMSCMSVNMHLLFRNSDTAKTL